MSGLVADSGDLRLEIQKPVYRLLNDLSFPGHVHTDEGEPENVNKSAATITSDAARIYAHDSGDRRGRTDFPA